MNSFSFSFAVSQEKRVSAYALMNVRRFVKSIIQDSAKKGYEKVLFPTGNTASKVEGHTTLEDFKKQKEDRLKELEEAQKELPKEIADYSTEINQLKQELERVNREGFGALKPIYNFYENTVTSILRKQGYNPVITTDEYGNTWNEVVLKPEHKKTVFLNKIKIKNFDQISYYDKLVNLFDEKLYSNISSKKVFEYLFERNEIPDHLKPIADLLYKLDLKVTVIEDEDAVDAETAMQYDSDTRTIEIPQTCLGLTPKEFARTFLHEVVHGYTVDIYAKPTNDFERRFRDRIDMLYNRAKKQLPDSKAYGLSSPLEFISEVFTNSRFVAELGNLKFDNTTSLWNRFLFFLKELFNLNFNVVGDRGKVTEEAVDSILNVINYVNADTKILNNREKLDISMFQYRFGERTVKKSDVITGIKEKLKLQKEAYKDRRGADKLLNDIKVMEELLEKGNEVAFIAKMVGDAEHYLVQLDRKLSDIKSKLGGRDLIKNPFTPEETQELLIELNNVKNFTSAYTILDDIDKFLRDSKASLRGVASLAAKDEKEYIEHLANLSKLKDGLLKDYMNFAVDALTEWIYPHLEQVNLKLEREGNQEHTLSKEKLRDLFLEAPKDIGFGAAMFGAVTNSTDALNALVAKAIKEQLEKARIQDIDIKNELLSEYNKTSGPKDNPSSFNEKYIREIELPDGSKILALHTEIDFHTFYNNKNKLSKELEKNKIQPGTDAYKAAWRKWYRDNTELRPDFKEYLAKIESQLTDEQFTAFINRNTRVVSLAYTSVPADMIYSEDGVGNARVFTGKNFIFPKRAVYENKTFKELQKDPYYKAIYKAYMDANFKLPKARRLKYGMLPQVQKTAIDGVLDNGIKLNAHLDRVKELWKSRGTREGVDEERYGRYQNIDKQDLNFLPIYYTTQFEDQKEVSQDLLTSVLLFSQMANKFDTLYDILPHVNALTNVVIGSPSILNSGRKVVDTVPGTVKAVVNRITGGKIYKQEARANKRLKHFLDSVVWGHENVATVWNLPGIGPVNIDKALDKLGFVNALSTMTLNLVGGLNNPLVGNINNAIEAIAGQHMTL